MRKWKELRGYLVVVATAYALMLFLNAASTPFQTNLKNLVFDQYQRWRPRPYAFDQPVRILDIDDESIQRIGQWPWPRQKMAAMVDALAKLNVAAISFSILFSEKERSSAGADVRGAEVAAASGSEPYKIAAESPDDGDAAFAKAIAGHRVALGSIVARRHTGDDAPVKVGFAVVGGDPVEYVPPFSGMLSPLAILADSASGIGFMNWSPDADRVIRQIPLLSVVKGQLQPSLALESLRVAQGAST